MLSSLYNFPKKENKSRQWSEPMMYTHATMVLGIMTCAYNNLIEYCLLMTITNTLSVYYHIHRENRGQPWESIIAQISYVYTLVQLYYAPSYYLLSIEIPIMMSIMYLYLYTTKYPDKYEVIHPFQHIAAGTIVTIVGMYHSPLIIFKG